MRINIIRYDLLSFLRCFFNLSTLHSDVNSSVPLPRFSRVRLCSCSLNYNCWMSRRCVISTPPSSYESSHPFRNFPRVSIVFAVIGQPFCCKRHQPLFAWLHAAGAETCWYYHHHSQWRTPSACKYSNIVQSAIFPSAANVSFLSIFFLTLPSIFVLHINILFQWDSDLA